MRQFNNVYLDIETYGGKHKPSLEDIAAPSNYKDPEKILKYRQERLQDAWGKQALNPLKGEIICIGYAIDSHKPECIIGEEEDIVSTFSEVLRTLSYINLIGYNVLGFDFPWLYLRAVKYNLPILKSVLPEKKNDTGYKDLMQEVSSTLYGKDSYLSLNDVCGFFGLKGKEGMDGSMVHQAFVDGKIQEIAEYCKDDVERNRSLYKLLNNEL